MEIVKDFDEKSYSNNGKPGKSSRILRVNPNFFIFIIFKKKFRFFFIFSHFSFFLFFIFSFFLIDFIFFEKISFLHFFIFSVFHFFHFSELDGRRVGTLLERPTRWELDITAGVEVAQTETRMRVNNGR